MAEWHLHYHVHSEDFNRRDPSAMIKFEAKDVDDAKQKILGIVKKRLRMLRSTRRRWFQIMAAPLLPGGKVLDGDQMVRNRFRYSNRCILRVINPDVAFVVGYGPEAREELSK